MSDPVTTTPAVERIKSMLRDATVLQQEDSPLLSIAGDRVKAILTELLLELSPREVQGPWQDLD